MTEQFVIHVDMSDPPLPRTIGPFTSVQAAGDWMATAVGAGTAMWNVGPLASPSEAIR